MRKLKIGLDFDGVIVNSHILRIVHAKKMFDVSPKDPIYYVDEEAHMLGLTKEQLFEVKVRVYDGDHKPALVEDAYWSIHQMLKDGHELDVKTARKKEDHLTKARTLLVEEDLPLEVVGIGYQVSKAEACKGLDVYIDDDVKNLQDLIGFVPHLFYYVWPWNKNALVPDGVRSVESWRSFRRYVDDIAYEG